MFTTKYLYLAVFNIGFSTRTKRPTYHSCCEYDIGRLVEVNASNIIVKYN